MANDTTPSILGDLPTPHLPALSGLAQRLTDNLDKWGHQALTPHQWLAILTEEAGEAAKEANAWHWPHPDPATTYHEATQQALARLRHELLDVAAVAVAAVEDMDRRLAGQPPHPPQP